MLLNQAEEAHSNPPFLRRSVEFGRTGLMCQSIEVEGKPVIEDYQRSLLKMKRTQVALTKRMHYQRLDGEEAQLLVEFDFEKTNLLPLLAPGTLRWYQLLRILPSS